MLPRLQSIFDKNLHFMRSGLKSPSLQNDILSIVNELGEDFAVAGLYGHWIRLL